ncbi:MAG TPA: hypothetical protein VGO00_20485 [Kofleriaceae bacterium]|nr:hypothetical protein [Kofleriaceae bacterium]
MSKRLGWLGPAIVIAGAAIAGVGVWYVVAAKPVAGDVIDTIPIDQDRSLVVRAQVGGDHDFIELHDHDIVRWQAFIPHYAGRPGAPGIAWSPIAVSIRVVRDGRAEIFAVAMSDAGKLGGMGLAPDHGPIVVQTSGPVTLTDHVRTYEIVAGPDWHQLVAIELATGKALWKAELGPAEVTDGGVADGAVWIAQPGQRRRFEIHSGRALTGNATL